MTVAAPSCRGAGCSRFGYRGSLRIALAKMRKRERTGSGSVRADSSACEASETSPLKAESHRRSIRTVLLLIAVMLVVATALAARAIGSLTAALIVSFLIMLRIGHRPVQNQASAAHTVSPPRAATFVGAVTCGGCHERELKLWTGSHHQLAMQKASDSTVLGDFNNASVAHGGETSHFFRRAGKFMVRTDGPNGALHDYEIKFTFGVSPLQQYLIELPVAGFRRSELRGTAALAKSVVSDGSICIPIGN
jgi:cytochrome c553